MIKWKWIWFKLKILHVIYCKSNTRSAPSTSQDPGAQSQSSSRHQSTSTTSSIENCFAFILKLFIISPLFIKPGWHLTDLHILLDLWHVHMVSLSESHRYGASVLIRTHFWENVKTFNIQHDCTYWRIGYIPIVEHTIFISCIILSTLWKKG